MTDQKELSHNAINIDDSFFQDLTSGTGGATSNGFDSVEECFRRYDKRVNEKIAKSLKQAVQMIVHQLNMFIDKRIDGRIDEKVALAVEKMTAGFPTPV